MGWITWPRAKRSDHNATNPPAWKIIWRLFMMCSVRSLLTGRVDLRASCSPPTYYRIWTKGCFCQTFSDAVFWIERKAITLNREQGQLQTSTRKTALNIDITTRHKRSVVIHLSRGEYANSQNENSRSLWMLRAWGANAAHYGPLAVLLLHPSPSPGQGGQCLVY